MTTATIKIAIKKISINFFTGQKCKIIIIIMTRIMIVIIMVSIVRITQLYKLQICNAEPHKLHYLEIKPHAVDWLITEFLSLM